jgi:hypothetical protein
MAETPLYRRLGAQPESPAPEGGDAQCWKVSRLMNILNVLDKRDNHGYL